MRSAGIVATGAVGVQSVSLPTERRDVDLDAVRERREAEKARQAARNPFNRLGPTPSAAEPRALGGRLIDPDYADQAFTTPPPEPVDDVDEPDDETTAGEPTPALAAHPDPAGRGSLRHHLQGAPTPGVVEVEGDGSASAAAPRPAGHTTEEAPVSTPTPAAPKPGPRPGPAGRPVTPPGPGAGPREPIDAAGIVREYVEDGMSIPEIAVRREHSTATVRRVLKATPGVVMRDDRKTNSGGTNTAAENDDPQLVDQVRRLYVDDGLTQAQISDKTGLTRKVVWRIMRDHGIPARPPANVSPASDAALEQPSRRERAVTMYTEEHRTIKEIAAELRLTKRAVSQLLHEAGVEVRKGRPAERATGPARSRDSHPRAGLLERRIATAKALAAIQDAALADVEPADERDDVDAHLGALTAVVTVRGALERAGRQPVVLDEVLRDCTRRLDEAAHHEVATLRLLGVSA